MENLLTECPECKVFVSNTEVITYGCCEDCAYDFSSVNTTIVIGDVAGPKRDRRRKTKSNIH